MGWFEAYFHDLQEKDLVPSTKVRYGQIVRDYRAWLQGREPTPETARSYLSYLREHGYQAGTIYLYYAALKGFFALAGVTFKVKLRRPKSLPPFWDSGDIERLIAQAERGLPVQGLAERRRNTVAILLMGFGGLRRAEVLGLRVADLDFRQRTIRVLGKGGKERVIPMAARLVGPLWEWCRGQKAGDRVVDLTANQLHQTVTRLARAAGLEGFHCHSLRHSFATRLLHRGANVREVQQLLGHESLETTAIYLAVTNAHLRQAVDLLEAVPQPTPR